MWMRVWLLRILALSVIGLAGCGGSDTDADPEAHYYQGTSLFDSGESLTSFVLNSLEAETLEFFLSCKATLRQGPDDYCHAALLRSDGTIPRKNQVAE